MVRDAAWPDSDQWPWSTAPATCPADRLGCPSASDPWGVVFCALSLCCPRCVPGCGVRSVPCVACAVYLTTWLLFTGVPARGVVLRVPRPWPLGSCSPVCTFGLLCVHRPWLLGSCSPLWPLGVLCCVCGVVGHLGPAQQCGPSVCCVTCAVSLATWLLFTSVHAPSAVCAVSLATWLLYFPCASTVCCVACAVALATCLQFTGVPARCAVCAVSFCHPWPQGPKYCILLHCVVHRWTATDLEHRLCYSD